VLQYLCCYLLGESNKKMKQKIFSIAIVSLVFFFGAGVMEIKAGVNDNTQGWIWGGSDDGTGIFGASGIGWISMNSINSGGAVSYGVNIPLTNGDLFGYAWSENLGYISFNRADLSGCPSGDCGATRFGNSLLGWARIISIPKAGTNAGGWLGWISLDGPKSGSMPSYGVTIATDGKLSGYAWSDEFGYISFSGPGYNAVIPLPAITLNANPITINLDSNPASPWPVNITWSTTNVTGCNASSDNGLWNGAKATASSGVGDIVNLNADHTLETFTLTCSGSGGTASASTSVTTGCTKKTCSAGVCTGIFVPSGSVDASWCVSNSSCSSDNDCAPKSSGAWKEVSP
jgi:hypothetical protein